MDWHPIRSAEDNPTEGGWYLVTFPIKRYNEYYISETVGYRVEELHFQKDGYGEMWDRTFDAPPIAWMPKPAPWRPEGEAE